MRHQPTTNQSSVGASRRLDRVPAWQPTSQSRSHAGFTMIEMLAAVLIMTLLVVLLFSAFHQGQRGWISAQTRAEVYQEGRALIETIAQEVELAFTNGVVKPAANSSGAELEFVAPISRSGDWSTGGTNDIVELCWVKYLYTAGSPVGSLTCQRSPPSLQGSTYNPISFTTPNYGSAVLLSSNVVHAWFQYTADRLIRIHLEVLDPVTVRQIGAGAAPGITNQTKRVLETAVHLVNKP